MTFVKFQVAHQEQLTETLIHNPDYITSRAGAIGQASQANA